MKTLQTIMIFGNPSRVTAQQKGLRVVRGHAQFYEKRKVTDEKDKLAAHLIKDRPSEPYHGPLSVRISWLFETDKKKDIGAPKTTRPDLDNLSKSLLDLMTKLGFWDDDAQIAKLELRKGWSSRGHGVLSIEIGGEEWQEEK